MSETRSFKIGDIIKIVDPSFSSDALGPGWPDVFVLLITSIKHPREPHRRKRRLGRPSNASGYMWSDDAPCKYVEDAPLFHTDVITLLSKGKS